mmetsp:Transcript_40638/g.97396  ORF Transcript_40638/g.97396 Transcript_40638/m.97396 type:complete len:703 (+) Transcript_40638:17-2125(+)
MEALLPFINNLQDVLVKSGLPVALDFPQIAVVGAQSVGKSSVLESIVGRDFLPRGTGIVTRRPLVLQLQNTPGTREWGQFGHLGNQQFENFDLIRQEIEKDTDRVCGKNKGVNMQAITLKIFSPHVIDLTLIDLPGLTKVPVGDQPADIESQIRNLVMRYIQRKNCLILAVTAANTDLANSDALRIARDVDPQGERTIGVITKIDIMDEGTDALEMLEGKMYPLKHGYIGVVCRSQKDIQAKRTIRQAVDKEMDFLSKHPAYRTIYPRCGTKYLATTLNRVLVNHIRETLPEFKSKIVKLLTSAEQELQGYGDPIGKSNQGASLLHLFSTFARNFADAIDGKLTGDVSSDGLTGGARIHYIFHDIFGAEVKQFDACRGLTDNEIRQAIRNATGPRASLFVPEAAFEIIVKKQIAQLEEPALRCVDQVNEELQRVIMQSELPEMQRFVNMREKVFEVVRSILKNCLGPTNQMIANLIQIELAYINTNHPDFIGGSRAIAEARDHPPVPTGQIPPPPQPPVVPNRATSPPAENEGGGGAMNMSALLNGFSIFGKKAEGVVDVPRRHAVSDPNDGVEFTARQGMMSMPAVIMPNPVPTERERCEMKIIKSLIYSYFNIVKKNIMDAVPKTIMYFMVNTAKENLHRELVKHLYREEMYPVLLQEHDDIGVRRKRCHEMIQVLRKALEMLNSLRDQSDQFCPSGRVT